MTSRCRLPTWAISHSSLTLVSSSPDTTQGESSTSSSTSTLGRREYRLLWQWHSDGGRAGQRDLWQLAPFSTPGVVTSNRSGGGPQQAEWLFSVSPDSPVATNLFQPFVQGRGASF